MRAISDFAPLTDEEAATLLYDAVLAALLLPCRDRMVKYYRLKYPSAEAKRLACNARHRAAYHKKRAKLKGRPTFPDGLTVSDLDRAPAFPHPA